MASKKLEAGITLSLLAGMLLILISPSDKQLGWVLKLIYLHGALVINGLILFTATGLIGIVSLFRKSNFILLLLAIEKTAIIFWVAATLIGNLTSQLAWGGIFWDEPRFKVTIIVSLISMSVYFLSTAIETSEIISLFGIGLSLSVWLLLMQAGKVMHPENPFSISEPSLIYFFIIITSVVLLTSILTVCWINKMSPDPSKRHTQS